MLDIAHEIKAFREGASDSSVQFRANNKLEPSLGFAGFALNFYHDASGLPGWWSPSRDYFLRTTYHGNSLMSGIIYGETARVKNMPYKLEVDKKATRREYKLSKYQDMLNLCQFGQGIRKFGHLFTLEYLTQDNGVFVELIGKGGDRKTERPLDKADISSMAVLDSARCWRTYDPEYPVIYINPYNGERHIMHYSRIYFTANFQQNNELARGVGLCALSRAYEAGRLILATNTYIYEKVSGQAPEIGLLNGITPMQLNQALMSGGMQKDSRGFLVYNDITFVGSGENGVGAQKASIDLVGLKSLPDGFDREKETTITVFILANAFGVDAREIWSKVSTGETKADAEVQDQKSEGKGRADAMQELEDLLNWRILPDECTYTFDKRDDSGDKRGAEIYAMRAGARQTQISSGEISVQESRELAVEAGDLPPDFLERQAMANDSDSVIEDNQSSVNPNNDSPAIESDPDSQLPSAGEKRYFDTANQYYNLLLELSLMGARGAISQKGFNLRAQSAVRNASKRAYLDGIQKGANNYTINELDPDESAELAALTALQISYLPNLSEFLYSDPSPDIKQIADRVTLWLNKGLNSVFNAGLLAGGKNKMMEFIMGNTKEKCDTCIAASGQVHRAKEWKRVNIIPQGDNLFCNGFNCQCRLEPTTKKAHGRLSRIPNRGIVGNNLSTMIKRIIGLTHAQNNH